MNHGLVFVAKNYFPLSSGFFSEVWSDIWLLVISILECYLLCIVSLLFVCSLRPSRPRNYLSGFDVESTYEESVVGVSCCLLDVNLFKSDTIDGFPSMIQCRGVCPVDKEPMSWLKLKFSLTKLCWNEALWLAVKSCTTSFNHFTKLIIITTPPSQLNY